MRAENQTGTPETVEQVKNSLVAFVEAARFESPQYQAASDYIDLQVFHDHSSKRHKSIRRCK